MDSWPRDDEIKLCSPAFSPDARRRPREPVNGRSLAEAVADNPPICLPAGGRGADYGGSGRAMPRARCRWSACRRTTPEQAGHGTISLPSKVSPRQLEVGSALKQSERSWLGSLWRASEEQSTEGSSRVAESRIISKLAPVASVASVLSQATGVQSHGGSSPGEPLGEGISCSCDNRQARDKRQKGRGGEGRL